MTDSDKTKDKPGPKIPADASGTDLPTLDAPGSTGDSKRNEAPPKKTKHEGNSIHAPTAKVPQARLEPEDLNTLDPAVALKTPKTAAPPPAKQPVRDNDEGATLFGGGYHPPKAPRPAGPKSPQSDDEGATIYGGGFDSPHSNTPHRGTSVAGGSSFNGEDLNTQSEGSEDSEGAPSFIGPYRLVQLLGEGGMGQVWLAEQTEPVKRKVALKLIKGGRYDHSVIQRFESERQSLAIMDHPAIAKVFDAGTTRDGQPFFVMEYVPGSPITNYCDEKRLNTRQRLELFIRVCDGVQHAHQKAIIHRDLKPGNIMVTEIDGKAAPHIIDFGIAKATETQPDSETLITQVGALVGTPGYMAPEQTDATVQDIDTRADVYSLGVILYELLTGSLPFDLKQWQKQPLLEVLRQIREDDPPPPSTKLATEAKTATQSAGVRQLEPRQLATMLRGDLDWITMKALEKDRARRYDSPTALAADITRYLTDEPVLASPPSLSYRTSKFVKRHRTGVIAATLIFLMLIGLSISMTVQAVRIARERDRANQAAAAAKNVSDFLIGLFNVSDPSNARGNTITAREILDQGAQQIETNLSNQPKVQGQLLSTIGTVYDTLGLYAQAQVLLEKSIDVRRRVLGPTHPEVLSSVNDLARVLREEGKLTSAEQLLRETLATDQRVLGPEHRITLECMMQLGSVLHDQGRLPESEKLRRDTLEVQKRVLGAEHPDTLTSMNNLGLTLGEEGRLPEAEEILRETLAIRRKVQGEDHPDTLRTAYILASNLGYDNHLDEGIALQRETLQLRKKVLGDVHPDTLASIDNLAGLLLLQHHYAEAEKLRRESLEVLTRVRGRDDPITLYTMSGLANTLSQEGRYKEADALLREAFERQSRLFGPNNPDAAMTKYNMACNAALGGHRGEAVVFLKESIEHGLSPLNKAHMVEDSDLKSLHGNAEFEALVTKAKKESDAEEKSAPNH